MTATLYCPGLPPQTLSSEGFHLADEHGFAKADKVEAQALGCHVDLVDVLAVGPNYVAYSIFDCEGEVNLEAMRVLEELTNLSFNLADENEVLIGSVLIVKQ